MTDLSDRATGPTEIERLQAQRVKLAKTIANENKLAERNRALVQQHVNRAERAYQQMERVGQKLDKLLDEKLTTLDTIQVESGEYQEPWRD